MKQIVLLSMLVVGAVIVGDLLKSLPRVTTQTAATPYNPYPAGILPADIVSEMADRKSVV